MCVKVMSLEKVENLPNFANLFEKDTVQIVKGLIPLPEKIPSGVDKQDFGSSNKGSIHRSCSRSHFRYPRKNYRRGNYGYRPYCG